MKIAAYSFTVSLVWAVLWLVSEVVAGALLIAFVALLVVPAVIHLCRPRRRIL